MSDSARKGRHPIRSDESILRAAFAAFAERGYDAMSVRQLNVDLGLSHETVRQRFGSKHQLFVAAVDHAVEHFYTLLFEERAALGPAPDDLSELRLLVRAFIRASIAFPQMAHLVNHEAGAPSERIDHIFTVGFEPGMRMISEILTRLVDAGVIYPVNVRDAFFIVDAGMSPYTQRGLSEAFDAIAGPLDESTHVDRFVEFVFRGGVRETPRLGSSDPR